MDLKERWKLTRLKEQMENDASREESAPLTETPDYHEHMEQRHKETGRGVLDVMYGDKKEKVLTWAENVEGRETYEKWAEKIVENKDAYYVAGQKLWLSSEDGKHQTSPISPIIDGFIDEQLSSENETWRNLRDKNPKGFEELQNRLTVFVGRKMEDVDFTPEDQHTLKFQALMEFVEEEQPLPAWRATTLVDPLISQGSRLVKAPIEALENEKELKRKPLEDWRPYLQRFQREIAPYKDNIQRESYAEALWSEGFIEKQEEWDNASNAVRSMITKNCWLKNQGENGLSLTYEDHRQILRKHSWDLERYQSVFGVTLPKLDELFSDYRSDLKSIVQNTLKHADPRGGEVEELAKGVIRSNSASISGHFLSRLSHEIRKTVSDEAAETVEALKIKISSNDDTLKNPDKIFRNALEVGCDESGQSMFFFRPISFSEKEGYNYKDCPVELGKGLEHIIHLRSSIDNKDSDAEKQKKEADEAIKEYLILAQQTGAMRNLLSSKFDMLKQAAELTGFELDAEQYVPNAVMDIEHGLRYWQETRLSSLGYGDKGRGVWTKDAEDFYRDELYFKHPHDYFSTTAGVPEEIRDKYADELRYASYSGFVGLLRVAYNDGFHVAATSRQPKRAEAAARDYFYFFDYSGHTDELRKFMEENNCLDIYNRFMRTL